VFFRSVELLNTEKRDSFKPDTPQHQKKTCRRRDTKVQSSFHSVNAPREQALSPMLAACPIGGIFLRNRF
jgi:hypothetical protein